MDELYDELRPRAFAIAYRMLGSVSEAEDVVQEGMLRLHRALEDGETIESPGAYLSTIVTRLAIDELRSARVQRERYVGDWLPEPLPTGEVDDEPARHAEMADSLSLAFLVLLESLSPEQRAVFLLHDVFDYPFKEIAEIVGKSDAAVRKLAERARGHVGEGRRRYSASRAEREELASRFFKATEEGDVKALEKMLAEDVVLHGDGGGKAPALPRAVHGRKRAARTLGAWRKAADRAGGIEFVPTELNGQPGAITTTPDGQVISVIVLEVAGGKIQTVSGIVNPDKLHHLGPVADVNALIRGGARPRHRRVTFPSDDSR